MKPPFKIYTVYEDGWGAKTTPVVKSITISRVSGQYWWFKERAGLEFHCRVRCGIKEYPTTARGAWIDFLTDITRRLKEAKQEIKELERFTAVADAAIEIIDMEGN